MNSINILLRSWLMLIALALPTSLLADENIDSGDVTNEESTEMAKTKEGAPTWQESDPSGANYLAQRHALVGRHCAVNRVMNIVGIGTGTSGLENLTNEDISDFASFPQIINATVAVSPMVSVRDMKNYYAAGTMAGFCIVASSGSSVLSLNLVSLMQIWFYKDGKLVARQTVKEANEGNGVKLSLIGIPGSNDACVNLTATSSAQFDEVALVQAGAVSAEVGSLIKIKYAFVGKAHDIIYRPQDLQNYCQQNNKELGENYYSTLTLDASCFPATSAAEGRFIDNDTTNHCDLPWAVLAIGTTGTAKAEITSNAAEKKDLFHQGDQVGFKYSIITTLSLVDLGESVIIKLYDINGNEVQSTTVSASVLNLGLASGGDVTTYLIADHDFSSAKIEFITGVKLLSGGSHNMYYAFVRPKPVIDHKCMINPTCSTDVCSSQTTLRLKSNPEINVTWTVESQPDANNNQCTVDENGFVTNMIADGEYKFRATAEDGCYEIITINHGSSSSFITPSGEQVYYNTEGETQEYSLSDDRHGETSANLLSISDMTNAQNILDDDFTDYASYTGGLQVLGTNGVIVGVKKNEGYFFDGSKADSKAAIRIGFVIEMEQTNIGLDLLNSFQIRCFDENGKVYEHIVEDAGVLGVGLIGANDKSNKLRLAITVPKAGNNGVIKFNEFQLWKIGAIDLQIQDIKMYYAFSEDPTDLANNAIRDGGTVVTYDNMGAIVNLGTQVDVAAVGCVTTNLSNIIDIDNELETYALVQKTASSGSQEIIVKLGRTLDYRHQVGVVVNNDIMGLNANVGSVVKIGTYYNGETTGEESTNWNVLGANVIQGSNKTLLLIQPKSNYDEIHITIGAGLEVNQTVKVYGIVIRNDIDNDGVADNRDEDSCPNATIDNIQVTKVCVGEDIVITGTGTSDTNYKLSLPDQSNNIISFTSGQQGNISQSITTTKAGQFTLYFYDGNDMLVETADYVVHPKKTTWRKTTTNKDWNHWDNWTHGTPYLCTDVIIPSDARVYPSLDDDVVNGDEYGCDRIFFESRAAVEKVFKLNYTKAWVNVDLQPNRYYLLSTPLQKMFTGDMFVAQSFTPSAEQEEFTPLAEGNYVQNRFAPRAYQRLWEKAADVMMADGNISTGGAAIQETRWSKRFNALKYNYSTGEGFSLWMEPEENTSDLFTLRFPKEHSSYNYFNEATRDMTSIQETNIDRGNTGENEALPLNHRFAYEEGKTATNYTYKTANDRKLYNRIGTVIIQSKANDNQTTKTFLVGNPFMSHIDVVEFLKGNTNLKEVKVYNGNTTTSATAVGNSYLSTDDNFKTILPMEAFFVTLKDEEPAVNAINVKFTEDMFFRTALNEDNENSNESPALKIIAEDGDLSVTTLLVESREQVHTETLFDNEVRPHMALFSMEGNTAHDINSIEGQEYIPLGIYVNGESEQLTLEFKAINGFDLTHYQLYDKETGRTYDLREKLNLGHVKSSVGRFVLVNGTTGIREMKADNQLQITVMGQEAIVKCPEHISTVSVFSIDGKQVDTIKGHELQTVRVKLTDGVNILNIEGDNKPAKSYKIISTSRL